MRYENFIVGVNDDETRRAAPREPLFRKEFTDYAKARKLFLKLVAGEVEEVQPGQGGRVWIVAKDGRWTQTVAQCDLGLLNATWLREPVAS